MAPRKRHTPTTVNDEAPKKQRRVREDYHEMIVTQPAPAKQPKRVVQTRATPAVKQAKQVSLRSRKGPRGQRQEQTPQSERSLMSSPTESEINVIEPASFIDEQSREGTTNTNGRQVDGDQLGTVLREHASAQSNPIKNVILQLSQTLINTMNAIREGATDGRSSRASENVDFDKKLPEFSGKPLQWMHFVKMYAKSEASFSDRRNIGRLDKALKGKAYELVRTLLATTDNPRDVIRELENHFGQSSLIAADIVRDLHSLPSLKTSMKGLAFFATQLKSGVDTFKILKLSGYLHSLDLLSSVAKKIPESLQSAFNRFVNEELREHGDLSPLEKLAKFIARESELNIRAGVFDINTSANDDGTSKKLTRGARGGIICAAVDLVGEKEDGTTVDSSDKCGYCGRRSRRVRECRDFLHESTKRRWFLAKKMGVCYKCFENGHSRSECSSRTVCDVCRKHHHTFLHFHNRSDNRDQVDRRDERERSNRKEQWSFGEQQIEHALIIPSLNLPLQSLSKELARRVREKENIEILPYHDAPLHILIGQDNWRLLESDNVRKLDGKGLIATHSLLGWSVHGYVEDREGTDIITSVTTTCVIEDEPERSAELEQQIRNYLELENLGVVKLDQKDVKNERAWAILEATSRIRGCEWETGLLWKSGLMPDVNSKATALKRLYALERKLDRNPEFAERYYAEMERFIANGYAEKVEKHVKRPRRWYLPHHGVENANKPGRTRMVHDAAATTNSISLNSLLEPGPDLLKSLLGVLLRFRQFLVAVKGDIKDMFLRIKVIERDRGALSFLWRGRDRTCTPETWESTGLIFGATSSPTSAIYIKNWNARQFSDLKPESVKSIIENSYMDDYLASGKSVEEMRERVRDVIEINKESNFHMHGWASNEPSVVADVLDNNRLGRREQANLCNNEEKVLGLYWDCSKDTFRINISLNKVRLEIRQGKERPTKRQFFGITMSVYDPLGLIAPFTL
ncbi:uncharacterized protein LOC131663356 [Phymastichus coffea]|uniref:uncharacterized protein LOC131663356 n=1 Tax=Phymastichus coffea TaxID=108790 RepID=UPI00273B8C5B|nr:uncharacterized protein LOC131663356 [Phymastichus coffea]